MGDSAGSERRISLDWMRGLVMVLMAIDHASMFYNGGRTSADSALMYTGTELPAAQFFTRWISHLCAPTFVFLAGTALALSVARRREHGQPERRIDRDLIIRGVILVLIEIAMTPPGVGRVVFQVMYVLGAGMICMAALRRLPAAWLAIAAVTWLVAGEAVTGLFWSPTENASVPIGLLAGVHQGDLLILYPLLPWLAIMMLGWAFGQRLVEKPESMGRWLVGCGVIALGVFALVRGLDGYGNMSLHRGDSSIVQWLHVSKYPPSLSFVALELGLMALLLAGFHRLEQRVTVRRNGPLLVLGQTALFFYLAHYAVLFVPAVAGDLFRRWNLAQTYALALAVVIALYPACRWYRTYKRAHPQSWTRYI